ncbi:MAG: ABC transporter ATP-binding protein [Treponema sp.]|jgi:oligopeptide/dipeptide ABC transporter ATP-binding protein|nr:ABC transporter ATP-binding protein [Treponema sp.]
MPLLTVSHLRKRFNLEAGFFARFGRFVNAINDISFSIGANETYGLVGESGCGKTTTARLLVRMYEADGGSILYHRETGPMEVAALRQEELRQYREKVKYVFQDPARSLNPRMSVYEVLIAGPRWSAPLRGAGKKRLRQEAAAVLEEVGLSSADLERRPSEFSGGQRQRISIARGILMRPELLICDEVVSALDVSIQGQILNLLLDIRQKRDISFLFIAHDLKVACYFCDRIGVMYRGELMEEAPAMELYRQGLHPYTRLLFSSATGGKSPPPLSLHTSGIPLPPSAEGVLPETPPQAYSAQDSCAFVERCPQAREHCFTEKPSMKEIETGHTIRCFAC